MSAQLIPLGTRVRHAERHEPGTIVIRAAAWTPNELAMLAPDFEMVQVVWDGYENVYWEYAAELTAVPA